MALTFYLLAAMIGVVWCQPIADLQAYRLYNTTAAWVNRTKSLANMEFAYSPPFANENSSHTVRDVGDFGGELLSFEYDSLTVTLVYFVGYPPVTLNTAFDPYTTQWIDANTLKVDYTLGIVTMAGPGVVLVNQTGFRYTDYFVFPDGQPQVLLDYGIQDPATAVVFEELQQSISNEALCGIIFAACDVSNGMGGNYLSDIDFSSFADCLDFMNSLSVGHPCPFTQRSNTTQCRQLHALSAFALPNIHCKHVRPLSVACRDTCLPACSNCDPNANCVATFPTLFTPVYICQCKNGYVGNGTSCTPELCTFKKKCPAMEGSFDCSSGLCECTETFTPVPTAEAGQSICTCPSPSNILWNDTARPSHPVCVPQGRCINGEAWQCKGQKFTEVKCLPPGNTYTLFDACICNPGFQGGWEYPCNCLAGNTIKWSNQYDGEVCLAAGQCTEDWHCGKSGNCYSSPGQVFGACVSP